ncbi:MAG: DMT family transporter [Proteobacteria bacterium]|nr:DMT family transporter [Pseudomonadota bacterium]
MFQNNTNLRPTLGLLSGAIVWGLMWYPLRVFLGWGIEGPLASIMIYGLGIFLPAVFARISWQELRKNFLLLIIIGIVAGGANLGFILAVIHGQVMRVVLLFYLAPVWTVLFARIFLRETLKPAGYVLMALAIFGAVFMLWRPQLGMPFPQNISEWLALISGVFFALMNVLSRKIADLDYALRSSVICAGVFLVGVVVFLIYGHAVKIDVPVLGWLFIVAVGCLVSGSNILVQYGLTYTVANQAILIFLVELVVAGISSWLLAGEVMSFHEWIGGSCIVSAGVLSYIFPFNQPLDLPVRTAQD